MARFDRQIQTALRLIKKNGKLVKWRQPQSLDDAAEPWKVTPAAPVDRDVYICFLPVNKENREFISYLRGNNEVKIGAVVGLMGNVSFEPSTEDIVIRGSETLQIFNIDLLSPNGQKILYTVEFKG